MSKKQKYHFNSSTLSFEKEERGLQHFFRRMSLHIVTGTFVGFVFFLLFSFFVDSPSERQLKDDNRKLRNQYTLLSQRLDEMHNVMTSLEERDNNLYRVIFQADPIPSSVRTNAIKQATRYKELEGTNSAKLLVNTTKKFDDLTKEMYVQSKSYDDLVELVKNNEEKLKCIPGIQPILNKDLQRIASGFGVRIDPVYHTYRRHNGMDFAAPTGTPVYATGNGKVVKAGWLQGYGKVVEIDHGFNYLTKYAHLHKINVRSGQKLKRGDIIGEVGSTGKSTGPHLHYEIRFKGRAVNPKNFYFIDLTPEEYDRMVQITNNAGQVLD